MGFFSWLGKLFGGKPKPSVAVVSIPVNAIKNKYALSVGIDKYKMNGIDLNGCVHDAKDFGSCLVEKFVFKPENVHYLFNEKATKVNEMNKQIELLKLSQPNDEVVFYHSGHGTLIPDANGDESDRMDEAFVSYDFDFNDRKSMYLDDDMVEVLKHLKEGVFLTIVVDTCHSGTISRDLLKKGKFIQHPNSYNNKKKKFKSIFGKSKDIFKNQPYLLLAACDEDQTSVEVQISGKSRGIYTYTLTKVLRQINDKEVWQNVFNIVKKDIKSGNFEQTPQFHGDKFANKKPFNGE